MQGRMRVRTALVTASAHGLGRATARCLAEEGVHVAAVDVDEAGLATTIQTIKAAGGRADSFIVDCTDESKIAPTVEAVVQCLGSVDCLVNNMGGSAGRDGAPFLEQRTEVFARVIHQCLMTTMLWTRCVAPGMRDAGYGKIINIVSDSVFRGDPKLAEYVSAKSGIIGLTRVLSQEFAEYQINVNAVAPGPTRTAALDRLSPRVLERAAAEIPMKRLGDPSDVAKAVAFFASSDSDYITGQTLVVDGGRALN